MENLTKEERSLLLFFETAAVDYGGKLSAARMNADDFEIAKRWNESGFVKFGRVKFGDIQQGSKVPMTNWCELSEEAWQAAHAERRERCKRIMDRKTFEKSGECK